jgi:hypothetical protein
MLQRLIDDAVLKGVGFLFRLAVVVLKWLRRSSASQVG